jgi:hypothetical protein
VGESEDLLFEIKKKIILMWFEERKGPGGGWVFFFFFLWGGAAPAPVGVTSEWVECPTSGLLISYL